MRIFVTVGSVLSFDRLIKGMDEWCLDHPGHHVFAQIGDGQYIPSHMQFERMLTPLQFRNHTTNSDLIVAHAGMGSVITAFEQGKPIVLLPRRASAREHTTDHQLHTVSWLRTKSSIFVADETINLENAIERAQTTSLNGDRLSSVAPKLLTDKLRAAIVAN